METEKIRPKGAGYFIKYRDINTYEVVKGEYYDYDYTMNKKKVIDSDGNIIAIACWQWELI